MTEYLPTKFISVEVSMPWGSQATCKLRCDGLTTELIKPTASSCWARARAHFSGIGVMVPKWEDVADVGGRYGYWEHGKASTEEAIEVFNQRAETLSFLLSSFKLGLTRAESEAILADGKQSLSLRSSSSSAS